MSLIDKIPQMDDAGLKNLLDNARRLATEGNQNQQAQAAELLPALEQATAARKVKKLEAAAERRASLKKPRAPAAAPAA